jgi:hypothetical protein
VAVEAANKAPTFEHTFTEAGEYPLLLSTASKHGLNSQRELELEIQRL